MGTILISHGIPSVEDAMLDSHRIIMPALLESFSPDEMRQLIPKADAVIACGKLDAETIRLGRRLKIIANYGAGFDRVDLKTATALGIPVTNIPDTVTESTAELAIGLMFAVSRRIGEKNLRIRQESPEPLFGMGFEMGSNLRGRVLGIIGLGRIGYRTAEIASALGMKVIGCSHSGRVRGDIVPVSMDEVLTKADILSLHCPLNDETRGLIGRDAFSHMKPGVMIINTARGAVMDTDALCDALEGGLVAGTGLDVFPDEPHIPERLIRNPLAVLTPHIGTNTKQTREQMFLACCQQICDALAGNTPVHIVNPTYLQFKRT